VQLCGIKIIVYAPLAPVHCISFIVSTSMENAFLILVSLEIGSDELCVR